MSQVRVIGIVGGGQLGRMLTLAAKQLGFHVVVMNPEGNSPAAQVGADEIVADWYDGKKLAQLADAADVITVEFEHLNADALAAVEATGKPVHPAPSTVRLIQDKYEQKVFLNQHKIAIAPFVKVESLPEARKALKKFKGKMLLKTRHGAYDGRGNALIRNTNDLKRAWVQFQGKALYAEGFVPFSKELAVMVARGTDGKIKTYPIVETIHKRNICVEVRAPAVISIAARKKAENLAKKVAKQLKGAGVFGIEMFLATDGKVLVNEIAPRVHNSGHYTTEATHTSQFEQHIRAITGLPLGDTSMRVPAAVMINILGERNGETVVTGLEAALQLPQVSVHLYGKAPTKIDRKMGHITATGKNVTEARKRATLARRRMGI
ncbi:MAG TPA: 5-(carboxyamino)imidazole ribonucleotide synthase [Patescibacteria group bacterium]|nr:5-(carboxyamino)imidazole ribonucleotide synthase [Patescibacteria group bacterium]